MSRIAAPVPGQHVAAPRASDERLRRTVHDLEGLFVNQLLQAMRQTVQKGGLTDGGAGEEMFQTMFDEHVAALAPTQWDRGLGEALLRQLRAAGIPDQNPR